MKQEFTIATPWKIVTYLSALVLLGLVVFVFFVASEPGPARWLLYLVGICFVLLIVYSLLEIKLAKTEVSDEGVSQRNAFGWRHITYPEIGSFEIANNRIKVKSNRDGKTKVAIGNLSSIANKEILVDWFSSRFDDDEKGAYIDQFETIMNDRDLAFTEEERFARLQSAKKLANYLTFAAGIISAWVFFYPHPYQWAIIVAVVFPLLLIFVYYKFRGLITIANDKGESAYPSLSVALLSPSMFLLARTLMDSNILNPTDCMLPVSMVALVLFTLMLRIRSSIHVKTKKAKDHILVIALFVVVYSIGSAIQVNQLFDRSTAQTYPAAVLNTESSTGSNKYYTVTLSKWGTQPSGDAAVDGALFNDIKKGALVKVKLKKGAFPYSMVLYQ